jgi:hypothetical protein
LCEVRPTVCVTCVWAGVDSAWEQENLKARKMLEIRTVPIRQVHALLDVLAIGITYFIIVLNHYGAPII